MQKGDKINNLHIETMAAEGKTVAKVDGMVIFLQGGAPGDTVEAEVTKIKSNFLEGRVTAIQKISPHRADPFCIHFGICGGCSWQHINYETQLFYKQKQVVDNLERIGGLTLPPVNPIIPSRKTKNYRNRLDFTFSANRWLTKEEMNSRRVDAGFTPTLSGGEGEGRAKGADRPAPLNAIPVGGESSALSSGEGRSEAIAGKGRPTHRSFSVAGDDAIPAEPALGFHLPRMYDKVFDVKECHLQPDPSNAIRLAVKQTAIDNNIDFFDLRKQIGFLRSLTIRTANSRLPRQVGGEVMVILQVAYEKMEWIRRIIETLSEKFPQITSLYYVINGKRNDTFGDLEMICAKGNHYITETMPKPERGGILPLFMHGEGPACPPKLQRRWGVRLQFRVGPKSFYQTNSDQAYELYKVAWTMADLKGDELVYDLYTGTGTIANFVAGNAKKVIGLEYVAAAIEDARVNSRINNIGNTEFYAGDIKDLLNESFLAQHGRPDTIITDPPRVGMHEDVVKMLLQASPKRIVYVSCNPATQARDLKLLSEKYAITSIQPVDMFPQTMHVENVVRLDRIIV